MRILLFGGSFDPPHIGHTALLTAAAKRLQPDKILVIPAFQAPLKGLPAAATSDRVRMARLGLIDPLPARWRSRAQVELSEIRAKRRVFTLETLKKIQRRHPHAELHFLVGSDSASAFHLWRDTRSLKKTATWWTGRRAGAPGGIPKHFKKLPGLFPVVASRSLRDDLAIEGEAIGLTPAVTAYIRRRKLYGLKLAWLLAESLGPERLFHVRSVARHAVDLGRRHGIDIRRARLAALLHDLGRSIKISAMGAYAIKHRLRIPHREETIRNHPLLLHAYISEHMAKTAIGINDKEVLLAVRHHTMGAASMSRIERLMYVADATSEDRDYPGVVLLRNLARKDLDEAFRTCVRQKLAYIQESGGWVHPATEWMWQDLR